MTKKYISFILMMCFSSLVSDSKGTEEESLDFFYFRSEYAELLKQKKSVEKNLNDLQGRYDKLQKENTELSEKVVAFEEEVVTLHKDTLSYKKEMEGRINHLYSVIDVLNKEKANLESKIAELQKKQNEILANSKRNDVFPPKTDTEKNEIIEKYRETQTKLDDSKKENETLVKKLSETQDKQKRTEAQLKETESRIAELSKKLEQSEKEKQQRNELSKKIELTEKEKQSSISEMSKKMEASSREKDASISELIKKIEQLEKEKQANISDLNKKMESSIREKDANITELTKKVEQLEKEKQASLSELSKKLAQVEQEKMSTEKREKDKEANLLEMSLRLDQAEKDKLMSLTEEGNLASLQEEKEKLRKQNQELLNTLEELKHLVQGVEEHEARLLEENEKLKKEVERLSHRQTEEIQRNLRKEIDDGSVQVEQRGKRIIINVSDEITFNSGSAKLKKSGKQTLLKLVKTLRKYNGQRLYIEGNTDNTPIRLSKYLDNWELSTARAVSVVRFLIKKGVFPKYITAAGNSYYNPIKPNVNDSNRAKNRRVDIVLAPFE